MTEPVSSAGGCTAANVRPCQPLVAGIWIANHPPRPSAARLTRVVVVRRVADRRMAMALLRPSVRLRARVRSSPFVGRNRTRARWAARIWIQRQKDALVGSHNRGRKLRQAVYSSIATASSVLLTPDFYFRLFTSVLILESKRIDDVSGRNCDVLLTINRK